MTKSPSASDRCAALLCTLMFKSNYRHAFLVAFPRKPYFLAEFKICKILGERREGEAEGRRGRAEDPQQQAPAGHRAGESSRTFEHQQI